MNRPDSAREAYLNYLAKCDQAFRPYAPIDLPEFFAGRVKDVQRLEGEISAPGRQIAIFGERGVGKTSLAKLAYFFLKRSEEETYFVRCERTSTFDDIFADTLASAGIEVVLNGLEAEGEGHGALSLGPLSLSRARRVRRTFRKVSAGRQISPRLLLDQFCDRTGLIIIDEYDRVQDAPTHTRMAELLKQFSDAASRTKIILVGVAETLSQLIGEHESLGRSLAQIKLERMSTDELAQIITKGEEHLGVSFHGDIKRRIVCLADGFPYFAHLIGRHAARAAGVQLQQDSAARPVVAEEEYISGLSDALANAEHSLTEQYDAAIVTTRRPSEKFTLILQAMALSSARDVQVKELANNMAFLTHAEVKSGSFNWNLGELAGPKRGNVLTKVREGCYKFTNPLMRAFVRSIMEYENIVYHGEQWQFPFMEAR